MKKFIGLFAQGIGLGLGLGLCLAGLVALIYRAVHSGEANLHFEHTLIYFLVVGGLMGVIGGWCLSLQMILGGLLSTLFLKIAELVPMPAQVADFPSESAQPNLGSRLVASTLVVGEEWAKKMETFFREIIQPFPGFFRKFIEWIFILRFEDYGRINRALDKAKKKGDTERANTQWMSMVVLHYLLEPLWVLFYAAYVILFLISCIFWSFPFFG